MRDLPSLQDHLKLSHTSAGFLLPCLVRHLRLRWRPPRAGRLGDCDARGAVRRASELAHRHGTDNSDVSVALVWHIAEEGVIGTYPCKASSRFLSVVRCRFQG